ncbi:MAG: SH3 domain-containing protein [Planctomycetales bacterium]
MRLFLWTAACCLIVSTANAAEFPYRAAIEGNEVYVRSGPGKSYYPTSRLSTGDEVVVHRHDPGGWYMIAPPPGSFSWIRAEYVRQTGPTSGEVTANNVVVRVGSEFGDTRDVEQRHLNIGDSVEIVGEETVPGDGASIRMHKIKPPQGEWRWIAGQYAVPIDRDRKEERDRNPYVPPSNVRDRTPGPAPPAAPGGGEGSLVIRELNRSEQGAVVRTGPAPDRMQEDRDRLAAIDERFREMVSHDVREWDLDPLEKEYRHLRQAAAHPALANHVELRLEAVERYRQMREDYDDVVRLARETDRRDQELLSMRRPIGGAAASAAAEERPVPPPVDEPRARPAPDADPFADPAPRVRREAHSPERFDGAGIVQRAAGAPPGAPAHALVAPNGRILAYLQAEPGIDLDRHVGHELGLYGERGYRSDLGTDLLRVRGLVPVRLKR